MVTHGIIPMLTLTILNMAIYKKVCTTCLRKNWTESDKLLIEISITQIDDFQLASPAQLSWAEVM